MSDLPPLIRRCLDEAGDRMRSALLQSMDEAVEALQAAEAAERRILERDALHLAWSGLQRQRAAWNARFVSALAEAIEVAPAAEAQRLAPFTPSVLGVLDASPSGLGGLSLVDDEQMAQDLAFAHLVQQWRLQVEPVMADLDAWVSAALGLPEVVPERNVLRPETFARALMIVVTESGADAATRARWLRALAVSMGRSLRAVYEHLLTLLRAGVESPARYRLQPARGGRVAGSVAADSSRAAIDDPAPAVPGRAPEWAVEAGAEAGGFSPINPLDPELGLRLLEGFLDGSSPALAAPLDAAYLEALEQQAGAARSAAASTDDAPGGRAPVDARRLDARWGELAEPARRADWRLATQKRAQRVDQALGIEVVRRLVAQVADDPRLLEPVREAIVAIEPALLRLALVDPRFFGDETHPGRRLISRVAQRSFKFRDVHSPGFGGFLDGVRSTFQALHHRPEIEGSGPFRDALGRLEDQWLREDAVEQAEREQALQRLQFAERRQELANEIAYELSQRPDLTGVPAPVLDFLFGPWSLVMAHARLLDTAQQLDPSGFGLVVPDLVWSVKPELTLRQPTKLLDLVPPMLRRIHAGLDLIGMPPEERQSFLDVLLQLHEPVLRLRRERSALQSQAPQPPLPAHWTPVAPEERLPQSPQMPWLAPQDRVSLGLASAGAAPPAEGVPPAQPEDSAAVPLESAATPLEGDAERLIAEVLNHLRVGDWADLQVRERWRRVQLSWATANQTLYLFHGQGGRAYTMTRRIVQRLLVQDHLRPVDATDVVARALSQLRRQLRA